MGTPTIISGLSEAGIRNGEPRPQVRWLVDNDQVYGALAAAVSGARKSISISQLALDPDFAFASSPGNTSSHSTPFIETLLSAAKDRNVQVRILLNSTILLNTLKPLRRFLDGQAFPKNNVRIRGLSFFPQILHAKMVIVDDETAFLVGSPFVNGYWDSSAHVPFDASRPPRELGGRPLHDVSVQFCGQPVAAISVFFSQLWAAGAEDEAESQRLSENIVPDRSKGPLHIATTVPAGVPSFGKGSTGILRTLKAVIRRAKSLIYIEQQYLSSRRITAELSRALENNPGLELIVVSNQNPDITAYARWQLNALREFGLLSHPRVGLFTLWSGSETELSREINQVFVHSKVVIIDDRWAMCGSANLDGVSLHSYGADFAGRAGRAVFRNVRNFDVALSVDEFDDEVEYASAQALREELWSEHLGADFDSDTLKPAEGWVSFWRATAARNVQLLNGGSMPPVGAFILPYSSLSRPGLQLEDCGVTNASDIKLHFDPGWFERQFALGWVRNMFL